jgi:5-methylcytosine-specific restriction enzyme A
MTLDDLLAMLPGLRRCRSLNAAWMRILLDRPRGQCTWCGEPVGRGRSTWCSDRCVEAFRLRCDPATQMRFVLERDRGICAMCGRDTVASERDGAAASNALRAEACPNGTSPYGLSPEDRRSLAERQRVVLESHGWSRHSWREVDHVVPVVEGGGLLGPDNLRLLCGACHAAETARLRKRLRKGRP